LDELFSDIQLSRIGPETRQSGVDKLLPKQLIGRETGQDFEFRRGEFQCDQYQVRLLSLLQKLIQDRFARSKGLRAERGMGQPFHWMAADSAIALRHIRPFGVGSVLQKHSRCAGICSPGEHDFVTFAEHSVRRSGLTGTGH
jgi:hypothetical protein